jgi:hypothetical protein
LRDCEHSSNATAAAAAAADDKKDKKKKKKTKQQAKVCCVVLCSWLCDARTQVKHDYDADGENELTIKQVRHTHSHRLPPALTRAIRAGLSTFSTRPTTTGGRVGTKVRLDVL